jgi:hypothetical protein
MQIIPTIEKYISEYTLHYIFEYTWIEEANECVFSKSVNGVLLQLSVIIGITNMEDGKHGLDELQRTRISTWEPSVSSRDVFFIVYRVLLYIYSPQTSIFIV